jgi:CBS-domain-containing membrane protein
MNLRKVLDKRLLRIRRRFRTSWKNYLYQSLLAAIIVALVLFFLTVEHVVVVASIGATAFIIFAMPRAASAHPRRVIGGHTIGLVAGSLAGLITPTTSLITIVALSLSVGFSMFLMVALDFEHPPASGTALGVALTGITGNVVLAVVTSAIVLSLAHQFFGRWLKDLV